MEQHRMLFCFAQWRVSAYHFQYRPSQGVRRGVTAHQLIAVFVQADKQPPTSNLQSSLFWTLTPPRRPATREPLGS